MAAPVPQVEAITVMNEGRRLIKDSSLPLLPDRSVKGRHVPPQTEGGGLEGCEGPPEAFAAQ